MKKELLCATKTMENVSFYGERWPNLITGEFRYYWYEDPKFRTIPINSFVRKIYFGYIDNEPLLWYTDFLGNSIKCLNTNIIKAFESDMNIHITHNGVIILWDEKNIYSTIDLHRLVDHSNDEILQQHLKQHGKIVNIAAENVVYDIFYDYIYFENVHVRMQTEINLAKKRSIILEIGKSTITNE